MLRHHHRPQEEGDVLWSLMYCIAYVEDEESVGYWSYPKYKEGYIYVNGKKEIDWTKDLFLEESKSLTMRVDKEAMSIKFTKNGGLYGKEMKLTDNFRNKDIYAFVCMKEKGDSVDVI